MDLFPAPLARLSSTYLIKCFSCSSQQPYYSSASLLLHPGSQLDTISFDLGPKGRNERNSSSSSSLSPLSATSKTTSNPAQKLRPLDFTDWALQGKWVLRIQLVMGLGTTGFDDWSMFIFWITSKFHQFWSEGLIDFVLLNCQVKFSQPNENPKDNFLLIFYGNVLINV